MTTFKNLLLLVSLITACGKASNDGTEKPAGAQPSASFVNIETVTFSDTHQVSFYKDDFGSTGTYESYNGDREHAALLGHHATLAEAFRSIRPGSAVPESLTAADAAAPHLAELALSAPPLSGELKTPEDVRADIAAMSSGLARDTAGCSPDLLNDNWGKDWISGVFAERYAQWRPSFPFVDRYADYQYSKDNTLAYEFKTFLGADYFVFNGDFYTTSNVAIYIKIGTGAFENPVRTTIGPRILGDWSFISRGFSYSGIIMAFEGPCWHNSDQYMIGQNLYEY